MTDDLKQTIRLKVPTNPGADSGGPKEEAELELISTQELHVLLEGDLDCRKDLAAAAESRDGVLVRNVDDDQFHIVDQDEVAEALARAEGARPLDVTSTALAELDEDGNQSLSLVNTMMLKNMLVPEDEAKPEPKPVDDEVVDFKNGHFDPYNSS